MVNWVDVEVWLKRVGMDCMIANDETNFMNIVETGFVSMHQNCKSGNQVCVVYCQMHLDFSEG